MGIYLNPGNENFKETTKADIYVDKTGLVRVMNQFIDKGHKYVCISRPRRFGKTIAGNMLSAYYSRGCDSRELFEQFMIASDPGFTQKLNRYNVIKIDMNSEYQNTLDKRNLIQKLTRKIRKEMILAFPSVDFDEEDTIAECILNMYAATGETLIIVLDEYDVLVREQVSDDLFQEYLSFLNGLFKSDTLRPAISLAYLTEIL